MRTFDLSFFSYFFSEFSHLLAHLTRINMYKMKSKAHHETVTLEEDVQVLTRRYRDIVRHRPKKEEISSRSLQGVIRVDR